MSVVEKMLTELMAGQKSIQSDMTSMQSKTDDMHKELKTSINGLTTSMGDMVDKQKQAEIKMEDMSQKLNALYLEVKTHEKAIEELRSTGGEMEMDDESEGFVEPGSKKRRAPRAAPTPRGEPSAPSSEPTVARTFARGIDAYNECALVVKGFPKDMMSSAMAKHAKEYITKYAPEALHTVIKVKATNFKRFYTLEFPSKLSAASFKERVSEEGIEWTDKKSLATTKLRIQGDKSVSNRIIDATLYHLYPQMEKHLKDNNKWQDGVKLGSTGTPRKFFLTNADDEGFTFFTIRVEDSKLANIVPNYEELAEFGLGKDAVDTMVKTATEAAKRGQ